MPSPVGRRYRTAVYVVAAGLLALPLMGAVCQDQGVVGSSDEAGASVSAERLCQWSNEWDFGPSSFTYVKESSKCGLNRSVYNTCKVALYATPTGWALYQAEGHGDNKCSAYARSSCAAAGCDQARGSETVWFYRLNNPARRWHTGFVSGGKVYCDLSFTSNGQHRMRCVQFQGNPPIGAAAYSRAERRAIRDACAEGSSSECQATIAAQTINRDAVRKYLDRTYGGR